MRDCAANKFLLASSLYNINRIICERSRTCSGALGNCRDSNDQKGTLCGNDSTAVRGLRETVSRLGFSEL